MLLVVMKVRDMIFARVCAGRKVRVSRWYLFFPLLLRCCAGGCVGREGASEELTLVRSFPGWRGAPHRSSLTPPPRVVVLASYSREVGSKHRHQYKIRRLEIVN